MTDLILFNPHAGNGAAGRETRNLSKMLLGDSLKYQDMTKINDYARLFADLDPETRIILSGGDGTLNRFVNDTEGLNIPNDIYYYATGSGNDFLTDLGKTKGCEPFSLKEYLQGLPTVELDHVIHIRVIGQPQDVVVRYPCFLLRYKSNTQSVTVLPVTVTVRRAWAASSNFSSGRVSARARASLLWGAKAPGQRSGAA